MWRWTQAGGLFTYIISAFTNGIYNWQKPSLGLPSLSDEDMIVASECSAPVVSQTPTHYRLHYAVPLKGLIPLWYETSWPEGCRYSEESIKSLSSSEMSLRNGDVSFNQAGAHLGRNEIPSKVCRNSPRCGKEHQEANQRHLWPLHTREWCELPLVMWKLVWLAYWCPTCVQCTQRKMCSGFPH